MRIELLETNQTIFQVTEAFRELASVVFESFGKDFRKTTLETFHDFGTLETDSTRTGLYSFRNGEFFYWVFLKGRHAGGSDAERIFLEFESQVSLNNIPIFQAFADYSDCRSNVLETAIRPVRSVRIEFSDDHRKGSVRLIRKLRPILRSSGRPGIQPDLIRGSSRIAAHDESRSI